MKVWQALGMGAIGVGLIGGLSLGLSLEEQQRSVYNSKIADLQTELSNATNVRKELNIVPPDGKGFIN